MGLLAALAFGLLTQADPHSKVDLVSAARAVRPGGSFDVGFRFRMDPKWHIYWKNPGESGVSPTIAWSLPKGWKASAIAWPAPERLEVQGIVNYGYEEEATLLVRLTAPKDARPGASVHLSATVKWLCCSEACVPAKAKVSTAVRIQAAEATDPTGAAVLAAARQRLPKALAPSDASATYDANRVRLAVRRAALGGVEAVPVFYPAEDSIDPSAPQTSRQVEAGIELALPIASYAPKPLTRLRGLLIAPEGKDWQPGVRALAIDIPILRGNP